MDARQKAEEHIQQAEKFLAEADAGGFKKRSAEGVAARAAQATAHVTLALYYQRETATG